MFEWNVVVTGVGTIGTVQGRTKELARFIVQLDHQSVPVETLSDTGDVSVKEYPCFENDDSTC